jgi:polysaccharide biosynthesis/export protein
MNRDFASNLLPARVLGRVATAGSVVVRAVAVVWLVGFFTLANAQQAQHAPPAENPDTAAQYLIGPGDQLQIFVWNHPELSPTVPVRPDGRISTPLVENMSAVRKTPTQLARDIEAVLAEYVRSPKVSVIVTQAQSTFSQVKVVGQVTHPQAVSFREGMTVLDAVLQVGGLAPYAAGNRARIVRMENGKQQKIRVKLDNLTQRGDLTQNVALQPGDVLVVPQAFF